MFILALSAMSLAMVSSRKYAAKRIAANNSQFALGICYNSSMAIEIMPKYIFAMALLSWITLLGGCGDARTITDVSDATAPVVSPTAVAPAIADATATPALVIADATATAVQPTPAPAAAQSPLGVDETPGSGADWTPPRLMGNVPFFRDSAEYLVLNSEVVARARLRGVEERIVAFGSDEYERMEHIYHINPTGDRVYVPLMAFEFEVLEYLKGGNGNATIWGIVELHAADGNSEQEARAAYSYYLNRRDKRWDGREAIVFLSDEIVYDKIPAGHHYLGIFWSNPLVEDYRYRGWGKWYAEVLDEDGVAGAAGEQGFWFNDPDESKGLRGRWSDGAAEDVIGLSDIRRLIALSDAELDKRNESRVGVMFAASELSEATNLDHFLAISEVGKVIVTWGISGANPDVVGYRVLRRRASGGEFVELANMVVDGPDHYEDVYDILPNTGYIYLLRAYGADGDIAEARVAVTTVAALEPLDAAVATPAALGE